MLHKIEPKFNVGDQVVSEGYSLTSKTYDAKFMQMKGEIVKTTIYKYGVLYDILTEEGVQGCPESLLQKVKTVETKKCGGW